MGKSEEGDDAIAEHGKNVALVTIDAGRARFFVGAHDDLQRFGIELVGEPGEPDHVAEQHRQLAALPDRRADVAAGRFFQRLFPAQQIQYSLARPERQTDLLEIVLGQHPQRCEVDLVFLEGFEKSFEIVGLEPFSKRRNLHDGTPLRSGRSTSRP
jgi:hypothetical protein